MPTSLCAICTRRTLSPCPIFISLRYVLECRLLLSDSKSSLHFCLHINRKNKT
ncbi:hypothetical protein [Kingella kingae]|uniref:hypothetical protein n=1 Tax=Kingella kingae TaxID=504 RepID=UPI00254CEC98|nr:hypothetical protein [Kingella kingae]MDK4536280.1 hypothetical protein [Kingella kingae]MDK4539242.1 hypothetical protein [Kingella kingae]